MKKPHAREIIKVALERHKNMPYIEIKTMFFAFSYQIFRKCSAIEYRRKCVLISVIFLQCSMSGHGIMPAVISGMQIYSRFDVAVI